MLILILREYIIMESLIKKSNLDNLKKVLKELAAMNQGTHGDKLVPLFDQMEQMASILDDYSHVKTDEDLKQVREKLRLIQEEGRKKITDFFGQFGTTPEAMMEFFNEKKNFNEKDWGMLENVRKKVKETIGEK